MKELYFGQGRIVFNGIINSFNFKDLKNKLYIALIPYKKEHEFVLIKKKFDF